MNTVLAFNSKVNTITDTDKEPITTNAFFDIPLDSPSDTPMTIGISGNMQGASTVNIPASTEIIKKIILLYL